MTILTSAAFSKAARKENLTDDTLADAIARARRGQIDANLGGHLIKQRLSRPGQGRSGGYRAIIYLHGETSVFLHLFAKNARANLSPKDLLAFTSYAERLASHTDEDFSRLVAERGWRRINYEQPEEDVPK